MYSQSRAREYLILGGDCRAHASESSRTKPVTATFKIIPSSIGIDHHMHACLNIDEIVRLIACELVTSGAKATAVALALCHKNSEGPVLDTLWEAQNLLLPLLKSLPGDVWNEGGCTSFKRFPTTLEWARFRKYARRIRELDEFGSQDILSLEVFLVLQHCAVDEPLFPNLKTLRLQYTTGGFVPFIPLFLSPGITTIEIGFMSNLPTVMVVSTITTFATLCPSLRDITLRHLQRDPVITVAVSGMLLATNRTTLRSIVVDSPLTEAAREVVYKLPNLRELSVILEGDTSLPSVVLPNLTDLAIKYDHDSEWLRGFHGATLGKLETVTFKSRSEQIGDLLLEEFARVALATSTQNTLSEFYLFTSCSWNPNHSSLLPFTRLTYLHVGFSCDGGCSSTIDDDTVASLARAMPKLEYLELGNMPCSKTLTGVTAKGLLALAHHCPDISVLRIHFQVDSLSTPPAIDEVNTDAGSATLRRSCALVELEVGGIVVAEEAVPTVAMTLALIFPRIESIDHIGESWKKVMNAISVSRKIVNYSRATLEGGS